MDPLPTHCFAQTFKISRQPNVAVTLYARWPRPRLETVLPSSEEISKAVGKLKSVEWEDIRKEKYFLTPPALFSELVRTATSLISRQAAEIARRQEWLADEVPAMAADENRNVPLKQGSVDKYGIDLEEFKMKTGKKPRDWKKAVKIAGWLPMSRHVHET